MGTQLRTSKKNDKRRKRETARLIDDLTIYRIFQYDAQNLLDHSNHIVKVTNLL